MILLVEVIVRVILLVEVSGNSSSDIISGSMIVVEKLDEVIVGLLVS